MKKIALHISRATWIALVFFMIFVAVIMSAARLALPMVDAWRDDFRRQISQALNTPVELGELNGRVSNFNPAIGIDSLIIYQPENPDKPSMEFYGLVLELDTIASLITLQPVFRQLVIGGAELQLVGSPGGIALAGYPSSEPTEQKNTDKKPDLRAFMDILGQQRQIDFQNLNFSVSMPSGDDRDVMVRRMLISGPPAARSMVAVVEAGEGEPLELTVNIAGRSYNWPEIVINGYASVPAFNMQPWLPLLPETLHRDFDLQVNQLRADSKLWFSYTPAGWDIKGDVHAEMLDLDYGDKPVPPLTSLHTNLTMKFGHKRSTQLWLDNLSFQFSGYAYPESNLYLAADSGSQKLGSQKLDSKTQSRERSVLFAADAVHLQPLALIADSSNQLPEPLDEIVSKLAPRGRLNNLVIKAYPDRKPFDFELIADLHDVGVDHWYGAPSGERIHASVHMTADSGVIDLDSPGFTLGLDNVFEDVWVFDRVAGQLYWRIVDDVYILRSDRLSLTGGEGDIVTRLRLDIPFDGDKTIWMALEAGITQGDIAYTGKYLPVQRTLSKDLAEWLNSSINSGDISRGAFIFNGPLSGPDIDNELSWGLFFDVANTNLTYSPDWPELKNLNGTVIVDQDDVLVRADKAQIFNSWASGINARVRDILAGKPLVLELEGRVLSQGPDALRFLQETPIATTIDHAADSWKVGGDLSVELNLKIPLEESKGEDLKVEINLNGNSLLIPEVGLEAQELTGQMHYSSSEGIYGTGLKGVLLDRPVSFDLSSAQTKTSKEAGFETLVDLRGQVSMQSLSQWLAFDVTPYLTGETGYRAQVRVGKKVRVDVDSNLVGVTSTMPVPLDKAAKDKEALKVRVDAEKGKPVLVSESLGRGISLLQALSSAGSPERIGINFGKGAVGLPESGVFITGQLESLKLEPWVKWWSSFSSLSAENSLNSQTLAEGVPVPPGDTAGSQHALLQNLQVSDFQVKRLQWSDDLLSNVRMDITRQTSAWDIGVHSKEVQGKAMVPDSGAPLQIDVERLELPSSALVSHEVPVAEDGSVIVEPVASDAQNSDPLDVVNPASVPDMNVHIRKIILAEKEFGHTSFDLRSVKSGFHVMNLKGSLGSADVDGTLDWTLVNGQHQTRLKAGIASEQVEEMLALWGYPELMTGKKLTSQADLSWTGSPAGFAVRNAEGGLDIDIRNGRFLSVDSSSGTGALRLFGVLNVDSITRRLRLDFSDLYRSGMAFDRVQGRMKFDNGEVSFVSPITVKGPSSDFRLGGRLNVPDQQLDMELIVTLPVTQNIAVVSLLLGQPYIAGAAYLFDKLLGSRVEQFASLRYEIGGSFGEPDVKLDRLFSNKVTEQK